MKKIHTAEEFLKKHPVSGYDEGDYYSPDVEEFMIEFAKLHVKSALKKASEKAELVGTSRCFCTDIENCDDKCQKIYKPSILSAYPLENIK